MKPNFFKAAVFAVSGTIASMAMPAMAADEASSLDELLKKVEAGYAADAREAKAREQRFIAARSEQQAMLAKAKQTLKNEENRSAQLEGTFEENEAAITEKQRALKERLGTLTELFGHLTSTAGDLRSNFQNSLISVQFPNREEFVTQLIDKMSGAEELPSIEEIERMWFEMQREMTESGKVVKFDTTVTTADGQKEDQTVVRVGTFNLVNADGEYLQYVPETGALQVLARQPSGPYMGWAEDLASASSGMTAFGVDPTGPTGGSYLAALIDSPTLSERWHQGGVVGYVITAVGVLAMLIAIWRLVVLSIEDMKVAKQLKSGQAMTNNSLGRVLKVHEENPSMDSETLELKLSEAILRETPRLERSLNLLKIIAAVAPLLGLLGTVTGMIITFQAITIFGAGDPKAMAGGISGALVTTVLGLIVAIPTVLLHTFVSGRAKKILHILDEQSTGIIAEHTEGKAG
ncbi:MotA/TolQ/ExbB proton channel family protein [Spongiibacter taiwanensis]|uniref:MotA/TolQ/ExbB proton channel family protein n=1 Tax=Spongiibacter taiwanensis TaxID=1748242 RepID=UPI0020354F34|nr:MotA/TolQ/ExbB proton channel family protein [Spongiibacter taiwanensis]USA42112.1 MotA/TolQ/ExbB proton channel family protein [Spongiibacter taiwanensis]